MIDFPTPTPWVIEATPIPTLPNIEVPQEVAVNAVQWWNFIPDQDTTMLQVMMVVAIIMMGIAMVIMALKAID